MRTQRRPTAVDETFDGFGDPCDDTSARVPWRITLHQDDSPSNPREENDFNGCVLVCDHRRYDLGDRKATETEMDAWRRGKWPLVERYLRRFHGALLVKPLGLLDHSGLHIYTGGGSHWTDSAGWDSGTVGFAYVTRARYRELMLAKDAPWPDEAVMVAWAEKAIDQEVETYDQYLRGDIWGFVVESADGTHLDSCWGFYGTDWKTNGMADYWSAAVTACAEAGRIGDGD